MAPRSRYATISSDWWRIRRYQDESSPDQHALDARTTSRRAASESPHRSLSGGSGHSGRADRGVLEVRTRPARRARTDRRLVAVSVLVLGCVRIEFFVTRVPVRLLRGASRRAQRRSAGPILAAFRR